MQANAQICQQISLHGKTTLYCQKQKKKRKQRKITPKCIVVTAY